MGCRSDGKPVPYWNCEPETFATEAEAFARAKQLANDHWLTLYVHRAAEDRFVVTRDPSMDESDDWGTAVTADA
jgi:hypothetical protein